MTLREFPNTSKEWDAAIIANAVYFTVVKRVGPGRMDRKEVRKTAAEGGQDEAFALAEKLFAEYNEKPFGVYAVDKDNHQALVGTVPAAAPHETAKDRKAREKLGNGQYYERSSASKQAKIVAVRAGIADPKPGVDYDIHTVQSKEGPVFTFSLKSTPKSEPVAAKPDTEAPPAIKAPAKPKKKAAVAKTKPKARVSASGKAKREGPWWLVDKPGKMRWGPYESKRKCRPEMKRIRKVPEGTAKPKLVIAAQAEMDESYTLGKK